MSDWIIRPGELMPQGAPGFGVWDGRNFHDGERGSKLALMQPAHPGHLCSHKMSPLNCLQCFHARANAPKPAAVPRRGAPTVQVNPVVAAVKAQTGVGQNPMGDLVPRVSEPVRMGKEQDGSEIPKPEPRKPTRGPMPRPVQVGGVSAPGTQQVARAVEPFSYASNDGRVDRKGYWHPARRESLIDKLPTHPEAVKR